MCLTDSSHLTPGASGVSKYHCPLSSSNFMSRDLAILLVGLGLGTRRMAGAYSDGWPAIGRGLLVLG